MRQIQITLDYNDKNMNYNCRCDAIRYPWASRLKNDLLLCNYRVSSKLCLSFDPASVLDIDDNRVAICIMPVEPQVVECTNPVAIAL